jgi:hypothetical protein
MFFALRDQLSRLNIDIEFFTSASNAKTQFVAGFVCHK